MAKHITQKEYKKKMGQCCPICQSENIEGGPVEIDALTAWQEMTCSDCGAGWSDYYDHSYYSIDEEGNHGH